MRRNLELGRGLVFSGQLLLELTARGMRREDAYRVVQGARDGGLEDARATSASACSRDPEIRAVLSEPEIAEVFRLERYLTHVDAIFARVFGPNETEPNRAADRSTGPNEPGHECSPDWSLGGLSAHPGPR